LGLAKDPLPSFAGILTLVRAPRADLEDLAEGTVAVFGVPFDISAQHIGARYGPRAMRETSTYFSAHLERGTIVDVETGHAWGAPKGNGLVDLGDVNVYPVDWGRTEKILRETMAAVVSKGAFPVVLGGDYAISHPLVLGFADGVERRIRGPIGYVRLTNRLDLRASDPFWGKVSTGSTARLIVESGAVPRPRMAWIGVNGYVTSEELEYAKRMGLMVVTLSEMRRQGLERTIEHLAKVASLRQGSVYLSLDMSVVSESYAPATNNPHVEGFSDMELLQIMDRLTSLNIEGLEIVGINPTVEPNQETTQRLAVTAFVRFLSPRILHSASDTSLRES
jgi:agmatinase